MSRHDGPFLGRKRYSPEQQAEWDLLLEWGAVPSWFESIAEEGDRLPRVRLIRVCPAEWLESEAGCEKLLKLTEILTKDPFTYYPKPGEPAPQPPEGWMMNPLSGVLGSLGPKRKKESPNG